MSKMHFAVWRRIEGDNGTFVGYRSACGQGQGHQRAVNTDAVDCLQCKSTDAFKAADRPETAPPARDAKDER